MNKKIAIILLGLVVIGAVALYSYGDIVSRQFFKPTENAIESGELISAGEAPEVVVDGIVIPWGIAFLSNGEILVSERSGKLLLIGNNKTVIEVPGVKHQGEGGLLGLALHPDFERNGWVYLYLTTESGSGLRNQVERYRFEGAALSERVVILENIPGAAYHDGGRIAFGPDDMLYVATGDAGREDLAQDIDSLAGKILRMRDDGSVPQDNPFGNVVYSYGHRNVQGIAWDEEGQLWATEHGRSGLQSGYDELNKIEKGANYGWPHIQGDEKREGMMAPQLHSGPSETWAPSGMAYLRGHLIFAGLRGESLYVADVSSGKATELRAYLRGEYGRLRAVSLGPDGMLYILTSNRDGRGDPIERDDRIIKIDPDALGL